MRARHVYSVLMAGLMTGALALSLALPGLAQGVWQEDGRPFGPHPFGPWLWVTGLAFLLRLLLVAGLILVVWRLLTARTIWQRPDSATQILRERYARGEISEDEYRKRLATLA